MTAATLRRATALMSTPVPTNASLPDQTRDPAPGPEGPARGHVACSMASVLLRCLRMLGGDQAVEQLLQMADVPHTASYLEDVANWIWYGEAIALFEAAVELTGDED